jgi:riboflavin transporter FmnP
MLCAIAFLLALLFHYLPIPPLVPAAPFLKFEPKDVIIAIGGFLYGPLAVVPMALTVGLLEMPFSATWLYGLIMNVSSTCAFACTASFIYKKQRTIRGAAIGLAAGTVVTTLVMLPLNYFITPFFMGVPRHVVVSILVMGIGLFNFIKYALVAALTMQLYKPLKVALSKAKLFPVSDLDEAVVSDTEELAAIEQGVATATKTSLTSIIISILVVVLSVLGVMYLHELL